MSTHKPKYAYLDKFNRYRVQTDKMLSDLEDTQMEHTKIINKQLLRKNQISRIISLITLALSLTAVIITLTSC